MNKRRYKLVWKPVTELTDDEYKKCYRLNFRNGGMDWKLKNAIERKDKHTSATMVVDRSDGKLISWGLMFPGGYRRRGKTVYLYTRADHRRKGFAQEVLKDLKTRTRYKPYVCPHDHKSSILYTKFRKETYVESGYGYSYEGRY